MLVLVAAPRLGGLVVTAYVFTTSAIFLVGVPLDETLRKESGS